MIYIVLEIIIYFLTFFDFITFLKLQKWTHVAPVRVQLEFTH